jgi:hypothetical protein
MLLLLLLLLSAAVVTAKRVWTPARPARRRARAAS